MAKITIGSIVHYVLPNGQHRPAIVVKVQEGNNKLELQVFGEGLVSKSNVEYSKEPAPGTWHGKEA